jgi:hypothetical protein
MKMAVPRRLFFGALLVAIFWWSSWSGPDLLGHHSFFPLWLGYVLVVDAVVAMRSGTSIFQCSWRVFALLFVFSAPLWWGFELANMRLDNWHYSLPHHYTWLQYHTEATIAFSTVLPAVLVTTELVASSKRIRALRRFRPAFTQSRATPVCIALGVVMIVAAVAFPSYCFPLLWVGPFFIVDPVNALRGQPSLLTQARRGDWRMIASLAIAGLVCGFFWEMWNSQAMPKWTYSVPHVGSPKLFEMPILGYGGYIPFAFELYAAYHLLASLAPQRLAGVVLAKHPGAQPTGDRA